MIHNWRRHNPALELLIFKQGFSACGLGVRQGWAWPEEWMGPWDACSIGLKRPKHWKWNLAKAEEENEDKWSKQGAWRETLILSNAWGAHRRMWQGERILLNKEPPSKSSIAHLRKTGWESLIWGSIPAEVPFASTQCLNLFSAWLRVPVLEQYLCMRLSYLFWVCEVFLSWECGVNDFFWRYIVVDVTILSPN